MSPLKSPTTRQSIGQAQTHDAVKLAALSRLVSWLLMALLLTACEVTPTMQAPQETPTDPLRGLVQPLNQQAIIAFIGQPLPASATNVHATGEAALDTMVLVRFDLPRTDVAAYLAALGVTQPLAVGYTPFFSATAPLKEAADWWLPPNAEAATGAFSGADQQIGSKHYKVIVVNPDATIVTVYLQVFNT